jgi:hypothetical protein
MGEKLMALPNLQILNYSKTLKGKKNFNLNESHVYTDIT